MKIGGNQIKVGNILEINSKLWRVLKTQHTQPGKGGAYLQVEMKESLRVQIYLILLGLLHLEI